MFLFLQNVLCTVSFIKILKVKFSKGFLKDVFCFHGVSVFARFMLDTVLEM